MIQIAELLTFLIPEPSECRAAAEKLRKEHPGESPQDLAQRAIAEARRWAAGAGGVTGAAANPLIMVPAALADIAAVLRIEGTMAGTVAALLDEEVLDDKAAFEADILSIVFPGAISQALRQIGVRAGQRLTRNLVRKYFAERLVQSAAGFATKRLFLHVSERAIVSKTVPIVGAGIGAGWNWLELHAVGRRAVGYYENKSIGPNVQRRYSVRRLVRMLPWHREKGEKEEEEGGEDQSAS
jgi:hypothetical protein